MEGDVFEGSVADEVHPASIKPSVKALTIKREQLEREQFFLMLAILTVAIVWLRFQLSEP